MKKFKVNRMAAMLKYSMWIADLTFTCKVFDSLELCFVLVSDKKILCKFFTLHALDAAASVKLDQQQYVTMSEKSDDLESGQHKASVCIEKIRQTFIFEKQAV